MIKNRHVIKTIGYKKNISVMRILSHIWFSIKTLLFIRKEKPEIIYCRIPPNTLVFLLLSLVDAIELFLMCMIYGQSQCRE